MRGTLYTHITNHSEASVIVECRKGRIEDGPNDNDDITYCRIGAEGVLDGASPPCGSSLEVTPDLQGSVLGGYLER